MSAITLGSWIVGTDTARGARPGRVHVMSERTGARVCVAETPEDAAFIALAPELHAALRKLYMAPTADARDEALFEAENLLGKASAILLLRLPANGGVAATAAECERLRENNAELRYALECIDQAWPAHGTDVRNPIADAMAAKARAAIAKTVQS